MGEVAVPALEQALVAVQAQEEEVGNKMAESQRVQPQRHPDCGRSGTSVALESPEICLT